MRLLDLFCGAGGAAMGYHRAGFDVVGVDIKPQKNYPFEFHCADAFDFLEQHGQEFDVIHASPPCQAYSTMRVLNNHKQHPDLVPVIRPLLKAMGKPYIIENVPGAPMEGYVIQLCGSMFGLRSHRGYLQRHRLFEIGNTDMFAMPLACNHDGLAIGVYGHGSAGLLGQRMRTANRDEARVLMGTPTMLRDGMSQAIPPAYTEWIGTQLLKPTS